ncbi:hypothetical protein ACFL1Z_08160 [Thermodesulfobacteriota bacterium]
MENSKIRNPNPFTDRQTQLLEGIREKIRQINDPDPEIITHESYDWSIEATKQFGRIPKLRFHPKSCQIKAELIEKAGMVNEARQEQISQIREKYGIRKARNGKANLFESEWNNIMLKVKKATFTLALVNLLFSKENETVSVPVALLRQIVMDENIHQIKGRKEPIHSHFTPERSEPHKKGGIRPYDEELADLD